MKAKSALIGKAGEMLVAAELMRRGVDVAHPASDVGVDLLAYHLAQSQTVPALFVPIQVKARSRTGYHFHRSWFTRCPGLTLVHVWHTERQPGVKDHPEFYIFSTVSEVEDALGSHVNSKSWQERGVWTETTPGKDAIARMQPHLERWDRITEQLGSTEVGGLG